MLDSTRAQAAVWDRPDRQGFRNEINPRNFTFRSREFEQMEIEFFCHPDESMKWYQYWRDVRINWYTHLGIKSERLRPREQGKEELAHYSIGTTDIEYLFPFAEEPQELEGVAHRGDYDLTQHAKHSGKDLSYFDGGCLGKRRQGRDMPGTRKPPRRPRAKEPYRFLPHVIEPSAGADRFALAVLCEAYAEDEIGGEPRTVLRFHPRLAPIKAAIFPLVNKDGMPEKAHALYRELKSRIQCFLRRQGSRRPPLSPPGRGRNAVLHHDRRPDAAGRYRDHPRSRHDAAVARADQSGRGRIAEKVGSCRGWESIVRSP